MSERGIETNPARMERLCDRLVPENATEKKSFLGLASYYRRFIPSFAQVARPLHKLTEAPIDFAWTPECKSSFDCPSLVIPRSHSGVYARHKRLQSWHWSCSTAGKGWV